MILIISEVPKREENEILYRQTIAQNKSKQKILNIINNKEIKLEKAKEELKKTIRKLTENSGEYSPFHYRSKWYYDNTDMYKCQICGNFCDCDQQASLNIARFRLFENTYFVDGKFDTRKAKEVIGRKKSSQWEEKDFLVNWYQSQLALHGYDDNGYANWNKPKIQKEI